MFGRVLEEFLVSVRKREQSWGFEFFSVLWQAQQIGWLP
jgi:hypothetical protein